MPNLLEECQTSLQESRRVQSHRGLGQQFRLEWSGGHFSKETRGKEYGRIGSKQLAGNLVESKLILEVPRGTSNKCELLHSN